MYDDRMQQVVEPGTFTVYVGGSSDRTREVAQIIYDRYLRAIIETD